MRTEEEKTEMIRRGCSFYLLFLKSQWQGAGDRGGSYVCELITPGLQPAPFPAPWVSPLSGEAPASPAAILRLEARAGPGRGSRSATP